MTYVGGFSQGRCLTELIDGAAQGHYNLNIGYGTKEIVSKLESLENCQTIRYYGKVEYSKGLRIMYNSDIIYAMYSKENPNHLFAAPNKYYEAMFVGKPIITTKGIITADKVMKNGFGYCIDESLDALIELVNHLTKEEICQKSKIALSLWEQYKDVTENYLTNEYAIYMQLK